jgi:putative FmdB family regulatory protein
MPLYEYHCHTCVGDFERRVPLEQRDSPQNCPQCNSTNVTRKVLAPSIHYFGNGWTTKKTADHPEGSRKRALKMLDG